MRGMLGAKYPGQETLCLQLCPVQPPGDTLQSARAPSRPACCFLCFSLTPCCRTAWPSFACMRGWLGAKYPGQETLCLQLCPVQPPGDTAQKRSSPVTPGVLLFRIFFDAVLPHGLASSVRGVGAAGCQEVWVGGRVGRRGALCSPLATPPKSARAPSRPACCFL